MTYEEKKKEYQDILTQEYKKSNPELTAMYTDKEINLMNPITDLDFKALVKEELRNINNKIKELEEEIDYCEKRTNDKRCHYQEIVELKADMIYTARQVDNLRNKYFNLKQILQERMNQNERSR